MCFMYEMYSNYEDQLEEFKNFVEELKFQIQEYERILRKKNSIIKGLKMEIKKLEGEKIPFQPRERKLLDSKPKLTPQNVNVEIRPIIQPNPKSQAVLKATMIPPPPITPPTRPPQTQAPPLRPPMQTPPIHPPNLTSHQVQVNNFNVPQNSKTPSQNSYVQSDQTSTTRRYTPRPSATYSSSTGILTRICPQCGAMGFAIKEVEDKNKIISYIPRRIYAKKKVCTKCFCEF